jgi:uncharacterized membrane protein
MRKIITKTILFTFLTFILTSTSLAAEENNAVENASTTLTQNALSTGIEESAVITIVSGLIILGTVAIASGSEDTPTAHSNAHGH